MKLVNHITSRLFVTFIFISAIWSGIFFYLQIKEIHDGIDEGLNNLRQEFIYKANKSPGFLEDMKKYKPLNIIVEKISYNEAKEFKEIYSNEKVYFITEEEEEEVRMLKTAFLWEQDKNYYLLKIFTSTVESDDLIKSTLYLMLSLWIGLGLAMLIVTKTIVYESSKPFYQLLDKLKSFRLNSPKMIELPTSNISEYTELNESIKTLLEENIKIFTEQRYFIENASHELQTPLAIAIGKLELLMSSDNLSQKQLEDMDSIRKGLNQMKRLNSSLLLLSKIKNKQFAESESVNLVDVFKEVLDSFDDIIKHKEITVEIEQNTDNIIKKMNKDLAYIMANNLIKNAVSHNERKGRISIIFRTNSIILSNTGQAIDNDVNIFKRYVSVSNDNKSSGLGLSIVKSIVYIYNFKISHQYVKQHIIILKFPN